jgi:hypothetical protein
MPGIVSHDSQHHREKIMVSSPAKWGVMAAAMFGSLALALVAIAAQVTPPNFGSSNTEQRPVALTPAELDQYVGYYVRGSNSVWPITRNGGRLLLHIPGAPSPIELVADSRNNFRSMGEPASFTFVRDAEGQVSCLVLHNAFWGTPITVPMPRIDASVAQTIMANNDLKMRSQTPTPGSEAALRRLLDGLRTRKPNYDEMAPWFADLVKETTALNGPYIRWGAVQSIKFSAVDAFGRDAYIVRQEGGFSTWTIWLDSNGVIQDADNYRMSD